MKPVYEHKGNIGEPSVRVLEHEDAPGEFILEITRGGLTESAFTTQELSNLAADLQIAVSKIRSNLRK
jgi:hypothetical protein